MNQNAFKGKTVHILIITDRLHEYAKTLYDFFSNFCDIKCNLIHSAEEFDDKQIHPPDFLLSVGYFKNKQNYDIVERVCSANAAAYCILLGIPDSCIRWDGYKYNYNDCFDRRRSNEHLLAHLQDLQDKRLNGFAYKSVSKYCHIIYKDKLYDVSAYSSGSLINPAELGIYPSGPSTLLKSPIMTYDDLYYINDDMLSLIDLQIHDLGGIFPVINGISPVHLPKMHVYGNINIPVKYTGTLILICGQKTVGRNKYSAVNAMFGCKELLRVTFENGRLVSLENMSKTARKVRVTHMLLPILIRLSKYFSPAQKQFWEAYTSLPLSASKEQLYSAYEKFF